MLACVWYALGNVMRGLISGSSLRDHARVRLRMRLMMRLDLIFTVSLAMRHKFTCVSVVVYTMRRLSHSNVFFSLAESGVNIAGDDNFAMCTSTAGGGRIAAMRFG